MSDEWWPCDNAADGAVCRRIRVSAVEFDLLHARLLAFRHPKTGKVMRFEAEMPADMATLVDGFRKLEPKLKI